MTTTTSLFQENSWIYIEDKFIANDISGEILDKRTFKKVSAKERTFTKVSFKYCIFDNVYFRKCKFDSCDFTGCKFINSNLNGSSFPGCNFQYCIFEKTLVDNDILYKSAPREENLKRDFARTLRTNYQQIGDSKSVNLAIKIELEATETHLKKSWHSKEYYYREKYQGIERFAAFLDWLNFKFLDFVWGNGEKAWKIIRLLIFVILIIALIDISKATPNCNIRDSLSSAPSIFFGVYHPQGYSNLFITVITIIRLLI
ncbi:pentapeptide repeat-containing protein, partial [Legionella pneumophila]